VLRPRLISQDQDRRLSFRDKNRGLETATLQNFAVTALAGHIKPSHHSEQTDHDMRSNPYNELLKCSLSISFCYTS
jgi:hypothetical protein